MSVRSAVLLPTRFPLTTAEKVEIEYHLDWLLRHFGAEPIYDRQPFTPVDPQFRVFATRAGIDLEQALEWVRELLPFDTDGCELVLMADGETCPDHPDMIKITAHEATDHEELVAHIACHLSARYLHRLPQHKLERTIPDRLMDLIPVYFGLGILCANTALKFSQYSVGESAYHHYRKSRSVEARVFGSTLAYLAGEREERKIAWARYLTPDARVPFKQTLRYLRKTNDSLFSSKFSTEVFGNTNDGQLIGKLPGATAGTQYGILQQLFFNTLEISPAETQQRLASLMPQLPDLLGMRDKDVAMMASHVASHFESLDEPVIAALKDQMMERDPELRIAALNAITTVATPGQLKPWELRSFLRESDMRLVNAAAMGLVQRGEKAEELSTDLLAAIKRMASQGVSDFLVHLCGALVTICGEPDHRLQEYFNQDPDLLADALSAVERWRGVAAPDKFDPEDEA
ncbi:MAG: hypothetical protein ACR2NP_04065 [Pirellulaceae bacterium]